MDRKSIAKDIEELIITDNQEGGSSKFMREHILWILQGIKEGRYGTKDRESKCRR